MFCPVFTYAVLVPCDFTVCERHATKKFYFFTIPHFLLLDGLLKS